MSMKGYLKTNEGGFFYLAPKVTTIGRDGCDLTINSSGVDLQHAVIEYSELEDCFVLQDLNTSQGTYVNDCRVQNAAVRLAPGDVIVFGYGSTPYMLEVESERQIKLGSNFKVSYPPVQQRPAWTQPLTVITDPVPPQVVYTQEGLPHLRQVISQTTSTWQNSPGMPYPSAPRPPQTLRSRPLSAGNRHPVDRPQTNTSPPTQRPMTGWVAGGANPARSLQTTQHGTDIMAVQEKEQKLIRLSEEVRRLAIFESECSRKEMMIQQLREEIGNLQNRLRHLETSQSASLLSTDAALTEKLIQLENDVSLKKSEIQSLKDQINQMKSDENNRSPISRQELNDRIMEVNSLKTELERTKKDKNITSGLVSQMQRDMSNKDTTIARLSRDIESMKKETQEKEVQISSLQLKFRKTQETKKNEEELEAKDKELAQLRLTFRQTEKKIEDQSEVIQALKEELEKHSKTSSEANEAQRRFQGELDSAKAKFVDMERAERSVRVDLEQSLKRIERFRNRVFQVTFSTPGIRAPDREINDDELMEILKKVIDERTELMRSLQDANENIKIANSTKRDIVENSKKIKQQLNEAVDPHPGHKKK